MAEPQMFWRGSAEQSAVNSALSNNVSNKGVDLFSDLSWNQPQKINGQNRYNYISQQFGPASVVSSPAGTVITPPPDMLRDSMSGAQTNAIENSYLSQLFAREQMDFQAASQLASMNFNSQEAAKNRDWQAYMSNTAHQREVRDLLAAGLNPILSAMGGNGATTGSGATASSQAMSGSSGSVDTSANNAIASLVATALQAENSYEMNKVNAITNLAIAEQQRKNQTDLTRMQIDSAQKIADKQSESSRYSSDMSYAMAELSAAASMFAASQSAGAIVSAAGINASSAQAINAANIENQRWMAEMYPNTFSQYIPRVVSGVTGGKSIGEVAEMAGNWLYDTFNNKKYSSYGGAGRKF